MCIYFFHNYFGADEGTLNPDLRIPPCWRWRFSSAEKAAAGPHGFCRGMKQKFALHLIFKLFFFFFTIELHLDTIGPHTLIPIIHM